MRWNDDHGLSLAKADDKFSPKFILEAKLTAISGFSAPKRELAALDHVIRLFDPTWEARDVVFAP